MVKKMNDYAIIWTTSRDYMPGTNASLNGFEFYGIDNADIYVMTWDNCAPREYKEQWPDVKFININIEVRSGRQTGWYFRFCDLIYTLENLRDYKVVLFWEGDECVIDNFSYYFEMAYKLDKIILSTNEHGTHTFDGLSLEAPYLHTWSVPYANIPLFIPVTQFKVIEKLIEYTDMEGNKLSRMDGLNYAIKECGIIPFADPGELWVQNVVYKTQLKEGKNKSIYLGDSSTRLHSFHRKYWSSAVCRSYLSGNTDGTYNKLLFNKFYHFFNTKCRVKWTEGVDLWDGT